MIVAGNREPEGGCSLTSQLLSGGAEPGEGTKEPSGGASTGHGMRRCTFSCWAGPGVASAIQGPSVDASITPSSSQM